MFCLPGETIEDARKTIELNIKANVQNASSMLLLPYPKTKIAQYCEKENLFSQKFSLYDIPHITQRESVLNIPNKKKITNVHYLTYWFVRYPWIYRRFWRSVYFEKLNSVFYLVYLFGFFVRNKNEAGLSWLGALRYAWHKRRLMISKKRNPTT